jgi:hypothetical protein
VNVFSSLRGRGYPRLNEMDGIGRHPSEFHLKAWRGAGLSANELEMWENCRLKMERRGAPCIELMWAAMSRCQIRDKG